MRKENHAFWVIVNKEISDHVKSWRFIILVSIIALTCLGSLYTALSNIGAAIKPDDPDGGFLFLKLFTASDGTLPSFVMFVSFLGPLLGIALGFDAVNSEQNKGTLSPLAVSADLPGQYHQCQIFRGAYRRQHPVFRSGTARHGLRIGRHRNSADRR